MLLKIYRTDRTGAYLASAAKARSNKITLRGHAWDRAGPDNDGSPWTGHGLSCPERLHRMEVSPPWASASSTVCMHGVWGVWTGDLKKWRDRSLFGFVGESSLPQGHFSRSLVRTHTRCACKQKIWLKFKSTCADASPPSIFLLSGSFPKA